MASDPRVNVRLASGKEHVRVIGIDPDPTPGVVVLHDGRSLIAVERFEPGTNPDCVRTIHGGTVQPAVAEVRVGGEPLCWHHAKAGMPVVGADRRDRMTSDGAYAWGEQETPITDAEREQWRVEAEHDAKHWTPAHSRHYQAERVLRLLAENDALRARLDAAEPGATLTEDERRNGFTAHAGDWKGTAYTVAAVERILAARLAAMPEATETVTIPKPQIFTGPKHQTVDEATASYLRDAATRVRVNRYWGSGVTALVAGLLDDVAAQIEGVPGDE